MRINDAIASNMVFLEVDNKGLGTTGRIQGLNRLSVYTCVWPIRRLWAV